MEVGAEGGGQRVIGGVVGGDRRCPTMERMMGPKGLGSGGGLGDSFRFACLVAAGKLHLDRNI
jgi:hypothetical protein